MLGQLTQFKDGTAQFVLSEIVVREVASHLDKEAKDAADALEKAIKKLKDNRLLNIEDLERLTNVQKSALSPKDAADIRLKSFLEKTGSYIVPADKTDIKALINRYFTTAAPFESSGKKKSEFPDAIALLSLENWAISEGKKVLAISDDVGWADFAKSSEVIDVESDLATALQKLQEHVEQAETYVRTLLTDLESGKAPNLLQLIEQGIADAVSELEPFVEASAPYDFEVEQISMSYRSFAFLHDRGEHELAVVQIGRDKIVARIGISVTAQAEAEFSFAIWDSIDKEYVPMGSNSAEREIEFDAAVLVTIEGDLIDPSRGKVHISEVELVDAITDVDFDEVQIDWGTDD
ncbi:hypothetical protein GGR34_000032 [Microvirga flocculans]|uniref:DUF4935 domain-containing protein n=2 Tax=Microvirga flocculans TaxID=217168 RepID=A0A7W6N6K0_9HYPH|nr:hypothetical protein [Microvirga flocculans]